MIGRDDLLVVRGRAAARPHPHAGHSQKLGSTPASGVAGRASRPAVLAHRLAVTRRTFPRVQCFPRERAPHFNFGIRVKTSPQPSTICNSQPLPVPKFQIRLHKNDDDKFRKQVKVRPARKVTINKATIQRTLTESCNIMKRLFLIALTFAAPLAVMAQTTVFNDNFAINSSSSYLNGQNGGTMSWASATGMTLTGTGTGKLSDLIGSFSGVTLANAGDYVSFVVNFNSPNIGQGGASLAGNLLFALDNSLGVSPISAGNTETISSTATGGATAAYLGYLGDIAFNNSPKTGTKFYAKTAGTPNLNGLSWYSDVKPTTQLSTSVANASNANLVNGDSYTLTYTVTALNAGASQMQITASIYDNTLSAMEDNFTIGATNGATYITPTSTFDTFDIGVYTGSESGYNINLTDVSVVTNVPEPGSVVLFLGGVGALALVRRFRR